VKTSDEGGFTEQLKKLQAEVDAKKLELARREAMRNSLYTILHHVLFLPKFSFQPSKFFVVVFFNGAQFSEQNRSKPNSVSFTIFQCCGSRQF
jgi:hypothetical protein